MTSDAIAVRDLRHRYGALEAVRGVSFSVAPGKEKTKTKGKIKYETYK